MLDNPTQSERYNQTSYRQNLLDSKALSSIKRHQVKEFIKTGSGSSEINFVQNDENSQLSGHLMQLKTSCSGVKLQIKTKINEHMKYKAETNFISTKVKAMQEERTNVQIETNKIRQIVDQVKLKKLNAMLSFKSYQHILDRMKKDEIKYQIKKNELQKELKLLQKKSKDLMNKGLQLRQIECLGVNGIKQACEQVKELNNFRKTTIENMNSIVQEKNVLKKKKQDRKEKSDIIKEMAAGDLQDADLIRMKKFLSVQTFLKVSLRNKMQKLKDLYEPYELAFLKIKCNTNIKDSSNLTIQYRNFENNYNEKSYWVKHLQGEIEQENIEKLRLEKQFREVKCRQLQILEKIQDESQQEHKESKKELRIKSENCQKMMMSVREWLLQQSKRLNLDSTNKSDLVLLKQVCEQLKRRKTSSC